MKFVFYTNSVSPHQLPLARAIVKLIGAEEYRYIYTTPQTDERMKLGWVSSSEFWIMAEFEHSEETRELLLSAKVLMSGVRDLKLFESRAEAGLTTIYCSERWFKPRLGIFRLLRPSYFLMAWRFVRLLRQCDNVLYYPMGIHAARDMARLCGLFAGDLRCLFRSPRLEFESRPGGGLSIVAKKDGMTKGAVGRYCLDKMRIWGYFVEGSTFKPQHSGLKDNFGGLSHSLQRMHPSTLKVLWVGRLLNWKRVDTIIRAVGASKCTTLSIYGIGPEKGRLKKISNTYAEKIRFYPPVNICEVRKIMHEHDVYVLSSSGREGWGAVVNEALAEGMKVIGTTAAGSSATMLPADAQFNDGDWRTLSKMICEGIGHTGVGDWTADVAAEYLCNVISE